MYFPYRFIWVIMVVKTFEKPFGNYYIFCN